MSRPTDRVALNAFACEFGDRERTLDSIDGLAAICSAQGLPMSPAKMGCGTFWQMTQPLESYLTRCISRTLASSGIPASEVNNIVFSTMERTLPLLDQVFMVRNVLEAVGLVNCVPALVSMQGCVSSLAAVDHAWRLFADPSVKHVLVVAFDFVVDDGDRVRPFAFFGDAVSSCLMSRGDGPGLSLRSYVVNVDFAGFLGRDTFESRKRMAGQTVQDALALSGASAEEVEKCFSTNLYKPLAEHNAGIYRSKLCIETLRSRAHCGNCDWMINLAHHQEHAGLQPGRKYLAQSFAPGIFACGLLEAAA
jgi:3-oxoacyl-[acyl-carrier-protein] synthase-3